MPLYIIKPVPFFIGGFGEHEQVPERYYPRLQVMETEAEAGIYVIKRKLADKLINLKNNHQAL